MDVVTISAVNAFTKAHETKTIRKQEKKKEPPVKPVDPVDQFGMSKLYDENQQPERLVDILA